MFQYIGARYVPTFFNNKGSNEWVSGISYEPLTIVTFLNNSYTSCQNVPSNIGSPNENSEYWVNTGNYNAQMITLQNSVNSLSNDLNNYNIEINAKINKLTANKSIAIIGDSYLEGYYGLTSNQTYGSTFANYTDLVLNSNLWLYGKGGAGFIGGGFSELLDRLISNKINPDEIWVVGGANDIGNNSGDIKNSIITFINRALTVCKKVRIIFVGIYKGKNSESAIIGYKDGCYHNTAFYNLQYINHDYGTLFDDTHPSQETQDLIGQALANIYSGSNGEIELPLYKASILLSESFGGTTLNDVILWKISKNSLGIVLNLNLSKVPSSLQRYTYINLGTISGSYFIQNNGIFEISAMINSNNTWIEGRFLVVLLNYTTINIVPFEDYTNITRMIFLNFYRPLVLRETSPTI